MYTYSKHVHVCACMCVSVRISFNSRKHSIIKIHHIFFFSQHPVFKFTHTGLPQQYSHSCHHKSHSSKSHISKLLFLFEAFSNPNSHVAKFPYHSHEIADQQISFFFFSPPHAEINNGCFSGLQSARGVGGNGLMGGIKYQGKRLGFIRDSPCKKMFGMNSKQWKWKVSMCCNKARGSTASDLWTLRMKTVIWTCCPPLL